MKLGFHFCSHCHRRIVLPPFAAKITLGPGAKMAIKCGNCKKGELVIKSEQRESVHVSA